VIGTHGRAIYILDDIRPLRALAQDPALFTLPVHLFEPPPAYLRNVAAVDGYHFPADGMWEGETRERGAMLTFWVAPGDSLLRSEEDTVAAIRILAGPDSVIRRFETPVREGLNRVVWDLRETFPGGDGTGRGGAELPGVEVLPGRYTIRVSMNTSESERTIEVLPDPRVEISLEDRIRKRNAVLKGISLTLASQEILERTEALADALPAIEDALRQREGPEAQALTGFVATVREALALIDARMGSMAGSRRSVSSMDATRDAPTEAERIALFRWEDEIDRVVPMINALITGQVADFRRALESAGMTGLPDLAPIRRSGG
jgi:hypothetical protein